MGLAKTEIKLAFKAAGSDGLRPPAARGYLIKQSRRPIGTRRDFARAQSLCGGDCRFAVDTIGQSISLTITGLRPHTRYYYAIAGRDNVTARPGRRSRTLKAQTA